MPPSGWKQLLAGAPWFRGEGRYPIAAYSEFIPPPREGKPYPPESLTRFDEADPWGWKVFEAEEALELGPGLADLAEVRTRSAIA